MEGKHMVGRGEALAPSGSLQRIKSLKLQKTPNEIKIFDLGTFFFLGFWSHFRVLSTQSDGLSELLTVLCSVRAWYQPARGRNPIPTTSVCL